MLASVWCVGRMTFSLGAAPTWEAHKQAGTFERCCRRQAAANASAAELNLNLSLVATASLHRVSGVHSNVIGWFWSIDRVEIQFVPCDPYAATRSRHLPPFAISPLDHCSLDHRYSS
jgi:hypothetical protein